MGTAKVSKAIGYAVLSAPGGAAASKALAYAVLSAEVNIAISKALVYAVFEEAPLFSLASATDVTDLGGESTISGVGFVAGAVVVVNGADLPTVFVNGGELTATVPVLAVGVYAVAVRLPDGTTASLDAALHVVDHFRLDSTTPGAAHESGGVEVALAGIGFAADAQVLVAGSPVPTTYVGATELHATVPPRVAGATTISVRLADGSTRTIVFTYEAAEISAVAPNPVAPQATITITGKWFFAGSLVRIGGVFAETTYVSPTQLTAKVPVLAPGTYVVEVLNSKAGYSETLTLAGLQVTAPPNTYSTAPIVMYVIT